MKEKWWSRIRPLIHLSLYEHNIPESSTMTKTNPFNTITCQPVERLDEQKKPEHYGEWSVEFITEDCERQKRLSDKEPQAIIKTLY